MPVPRGLTSVMPTIPMLADRREKMPGRVGIKLYFFELISYVATFVQYLIIVAGLFSLSQDFMRGAEGRNNIATFLMKLKIMAIRPRGTTLEI